MKDDLIMLEASEDVSCVSANGNQYEKNKDGFFCVSGEDVNKLLEIGLKQAVVKEKKKAQDDKPDKK